MPRSKRADVQHTAPAGEDVQRGDGLREQAGFAVDDPGDKGQQFRGAGMRGDEVERRVRLEHLVLGRSVIGSLPEAVHHADPLEAGCVRGRRNVGENGTEPWRSLQTIEPRDVQTNPQCHRPLPTRDVQTLPAWLRRSGYPQ